MDNIIKNMSSGKALKIYLDIIDGVIRYRSGGIIEIEYPGDTDIYDNYGDLIASIKCTLKELKNEKMEGLENVEL